MRARGVVLRGRPMRCTLAAAVLISAVTIAGAGADEIAPVNRDQAVHHQLPHPDVGGLQPLKLWSTTYHIPLVLRDHGACRFLNTSGNALAEGISIRDWCTASIEGTVAVVRTNCARRLINMAGIGTPEPVDCSPYYSQGVPEGLTKQRWADAVGPFGDGVDGLQLVPFRTIAVDRRTVKYGTVLFVPEAVGAVVPLPGGCTVKHDGYFFAADKGGGVSGNHIDTFQGYASGKHLPYAPGDASRTFAAYVITRPDIVAVLRELHANPPLDPCHEDAGLRACLQAPIIVNGRELDALPHRHVCLIASTVLPHLRGTRQERVRNAARVTWWSLREGTLWLANPHAMTLCASGGSDHCIGRTDTCSAAWQVGMASAQVRNHTDAEVAAQVLALFPHASPTDVLKSALRMADVDPEDAAGRELLESHDVPLRRSWFLRHPVVGMTLQAGVVGARCFDAWNRECGRLGYPEAERFAATRAVVRKSVDDLVRFYDAQLPR
jgi:3D (Asp-Asp-Asp) domain-containing protein